METIAIPIWQGCVSSVFDFADTVQIVTLVKNRIVSRYEINLAELDVCTRSNRLIEAGPSVLLCGAISRYQAERIRLAGIEVLSLVCGPIDRIIEAYIRRQLTQPEFRLPGCQEDPGPCHRNRRGHCSRRN